MASNVGTLTTGTLSAYASPLAVAEPILSPVILQISSIIGSKVCECVTLLLIVYSAVIISSVSIAVEHTRDDASIASIFILKIL